MLRSARRVARADGGAITLVTLILGAMMLAFVGFVWDGGQAVSATQTADDLARETGRTVAQCVDVRYFLLNGTATVLNQNMAQDCAVSFASLYNNAGNGYQMSAAVTMTPPENGNVLNVTVTLTKPTGFLSGLSTTGSYTGHATVTLTQGVTDAGG